MRKKIKTIGFGAALIILPLLTALAVIGVGRYSLSFAQSLEVLWKTLWFGKDSVNAQAYSVIINMRLPRILTAIVCGGGLAAAGAALQAMFSNPLVSPDTLGVGSGASFGAALALLLGGNLITVQLSALAFGIVAVSCTYVVARSKGKGTPIIMLVLAGMVVSALFQAFVSLVKYSADTENQLPEITYWLMGSLTRSTFKSLSLGALPIIISVFVLFLLRWILNVLSLSEDEAKSLGVNVVRIRVVIILASTMITASTVSMCGQIGWVGLLIPHVSRMMFGSNNRIVIPASISLGMVFMMLIDTIARSATSAEIPVSILTAIVGAPCFIILLKRTGGSWN